MALKLNKQNIILHLQIITIVPPRTLYAILWNNLYTRNFKELLNEIFNALRKFLISQMNIFKCRVRFLKYSYGNY